MLHTALRKRAYVLTLIIVLSILLTAMTAIAASKLITAKKGGTIDIAPGVKLVIRPNTLEEDTVISASMSIESNGDITYEFGPDDIDFSKPVELIISKRVLKDAKIKDFVLYGADGEEIRAKKSKKELIYKIEHFSLYYHRRR